MLKKYLVEFEWSTTWIVEAESRDEVLRIARIDYKAHDEALYDVKYNPVIHITGPLKRDQEPDATACNDRLVHPEDADAEEFRALHYEECEDV